MAGTGPGHRGVRRPPQPAVHRRLRDARLGRRRRGRAAGDLAAVGGRRPRHGARPARLPGPDHHPAGAEPAAHARPAQGVLRRLLAARAAAHRAGRGRGRRARRQRLDGDAAGAGDALADRAGRVRAARGVRPGLRRDRRGRRQEPGRGPPDRAPRPRARRRAPPARGRSPRRDPARARVRSSARSRPATCKACSTCSPPTSSSSATVAASRRRCCGRSWAPTRWPRAGRSDCGKIDARPPLQPGAGQRLPGAGLRLDGEVDTVIAVRIDDGLITGLYAVRNPEKLSHMEQETALRR